MLKTTIGLCLHKNLDSLKYTMLLFCFMLSYDFYLFLLPFISFGIYVGFTSFHHSKHP